MTMDILPVKTLDVKNRLGECVLWDVRQSAVLWTDIESALFWRWDFPDGEPQSFPLPERLGSFALTDIVGTYLGAFESGFATFMPSEEKFQLIASVSAEHKHLRMNDGRVDRQGRFWAATIAEQDPVGDEPWGTLWRYDGGGQASPNLSGFKIPNSLCWSRDGKTMYFADSPQNTIWRYAFDVDKGPVGGPVIFAKTDKHVHPDGSCIDSEDHLWNAQWGAGEVVRYRPDGSIERRLKLPVSQPSCVAFGGPDLDILFVTTARVDLSEEQLLGEPLAGALFAYKIDIKGIPEMICHTAR